MIQNIWVAHSVIVSAHTKEPNWLFLKSWSRKLCFQEFTLFINVIETNPEVELVEQEGLDMVLLFPAGDLRQVASIGPTKLDMTHDTNPPSEHLARSTSRLTWGSRSVRPGSSRGAGAVRPAGGGGHHGLGQLGQADRGEGHQLLSTTLLNTFCLIYLYLLFRM